MAPEEGPPPTSAAIDTKMLRKTANSIAGRTEIRYTFVYFSGAHLA